jgi:hypothetical protein
MRSPHRARPEDRAGGTRAARPATRRAPLPSVKRRARIIHAVPRGFLPLVRH